jgi:hypothetical protein
MRLIDADKLKEYLQSRLKEAEEKFAYEESKKEARHVTNLLCNDADAQETVEAISQDWIRGYINRLKDMGVVISIRDAQAVSVMVDKYMMEQNGNATCGPDYCDINFGGGTKA